MKIARIVGMVGVLFLLGLLFGCAQLPTGLEENDEDSSGKWVALGLSQDQAQPDGCVQDLSKREAKKEAREALQEEEVQELKDALSSLGKRLKLNKAQGCKVEVSDSTESDSSGQPQWATLSTSDGTDGVFLEIPAGKDAALYVLELGEDMAAWASIKESEAGGERLVHMELGLEEDSDAMALSSDGSESISSWELFLPDEQGIQEIVGQVQQMLTADSGGASQQAKALSSDLDVDWSAAEVIIDEAAGEALIVLPPSENAQSQALWGKGGSSFNDSSSVFVKVSIRSEPNAARPVWKVGSAVLQMRRGREYERHFELCPYRWYGKLAAFKRPLCQGYLGPFNNPQIIPRDFQFQLLSALLQAWGNKTVYAEFSGKRMLFYKVGPLTSEELKELVEGAWGQVQQDVGELIFSWDPAEVARVINEIWNEILRVKDKLDPEQLQTYITGLVVKYYRENKDFKSFVDELARSEKILDILREIILGLEPTGLVGILLAILENPELPPGLKTMEIFLWIMVQYPSVQEPLMSLLEGVDKRYQVDVVTLAVMLYGFAEDPAFQDVGLKSSLVTAFFQAFAEALKAGKLDLIVNIWNFLEFYLIEFQQTAIDADILEERYADAVATALAAFNAIKYGWGVGLGFFKGRAMATMSATIDGKVYHFFVHAEASFGPEDLEEIPSFIEDVINLVGEKLIADPKVTEGVIIPIFEASAQEIEQLKAKIKELNIPAGFPTIIVWVDENTGKVHGECVAGCKGMTPQQVQQLLEEAARAQFGVGLGEKWPGWTDPQIETEVMAFLQKAEEAGYGILSKPCCLGR